MTTTSRRTGHVVGRTYNSWALGAYVVLSIGADGWPIVRWVTSGHVGPHQAVTG